MGRLLNLILWALVVWGGGLLLFIATLPGVDDNTRKLTRFQSSPVQASAVVVLTGGGGHRIAAAMTVFERGIGQRLLISGVHRDTTREDLRDLWHGHPPRFDCCVDLDVEALSTRGNAIETAQWAEYNQFQKLLLVTSDYHLPRALVELRAAMPDVDIVGYASESRYLTFHGFPGSLQAWRAVGIEYSKYITSSIRHFIRM